MEIKKLRLNELKLNAANPREVVEEKYSQLIDSILVFPKMLDLRPAVYNAEKVVLGGNMRLRALQEIATMSVTSIQGRLEGLEGYRKKPQAERVALLEFWQRWLDSPYAPAASAEGLTDAEQQEFIIKDNLSFGKWDWEALANDWDEEQLGEWGLDVWQPEQEEETPETKEDEFDEDGAIEVRCKKGDIWQLGEHRLMCGDSTDFEQVRMLMGGTKADMIFTDPPYGVSYANKNEFLNKLDGGERNTCEIENDSKTPQEMYGFWKKCFKNLCECSKDKMVYYITAPQGGDLLLLLLLLQAIRDSGFMLKHQLVWNKNNFVLGRCDYNYKHEPIIYGWKIGGTHTFYGKSPYKTSVWDIDRPHQSKLHPTMKPVALVSAAMLDGSKEGDVVLDLFGGSGTTIIAAEQLGRKARLMEIDTHYCDVIIQRWEEFTGAKAKKIN